MNTETAPPRDIVDRNKPVPVREFRACDACPNEAQVEAFYFVTVFGQDLAYCGHHANKFEVALLPKVTKMVDLRYTIDVDRNAPPQQ